MRSTRCSTTRCSTKRATDPPQGVGAPRRGASTLDHPQGPPGIFSPVLRHRGRGRRVSCAPPPGPQGAPPALFGRGCSTPAMGSATVHQERGAILEPSRTGPVGPPGCPGAGLRPAPLALTQTSDLSRPRPAPPLVRGSPGRCAELVRPRASPSKHSYPAARHGPRGAPRLSTLRPVVPPSHEGGE